MNEGYFVIQRALLEHEVWLEKPFGKGQAWADLIGRANYKQAERLIGCDLIKVPRGQLVTSIRALADRWGWSTNRVVRFIRTLEAAQMVTTKRTRWGTFITICKYNDYQLSRDTDGYTKETEKRRKRDGKETEKGDTIKKEKKEKKENKDNNARARATLPSFEDSDERIVIGADGKEYVEVDHL